MYMVTFVLGDPTRLDEVLEAWNRINVSGVTILETTGLHRRRHQALGARYAFAFPTLDARYAGHFTLLAVVKGSEDVHAIADAAAAVVGDLNSPNTGVLFAWPIEIVIGLTDFQDESE